MKKHEAEKIIAVIRELSEAADAAGVSRPPVHGAVKAPAASERSDANSNGHHVISAEQLERIYQEIKKRFIDELPSDPVLVQLIATRPEIVLELEPKTVTLDGSTLRGRLAKLVAEGFFDAARRTGEARTEMGRTGSDPNGGQLSTTLGEFVVQGFLTREGDRYKRAPSLKITRHDIEAR